MEEITYWGGMLSFVGIVILTFLNTSYLYSEHRGGRSLSSIFKPFVRTLRFWVHAACVIGVLILGLLRSPHSSVVAELSRLLFLVLFVMTLIILTTIWGIRNLSSDDKPPH